MASAAPERMELRIDRDAEALRGARVSAWPALILPLETAIVTLRAATTTAQLDRAQLALLPARLPHAIAAPAAGSIALVTLGVSDGLRTLAARDYPEVQLRRLAEVLSDVRILPRTRWVDELVHRYVFERSVCARRHSRAARFIEAELVKEVYFLGCEQLARRTRASVLFEGDAVAARARAWIDAHLFEPFAIDELVAACHVSQSTVLRAFRRETGVSPLAYLRRRRLEESMQLLASGRYGVTEVATRVGYDNPSAFAAAFRAHFGVAPSQARASLSAEARLPAHGAPLTPTVAAKPRARPRRRRRD